MNQLNKEMKKSLIIALMATFALGANAQTDSLAMEKKTHELQEVVVKSDVARTSAEKSTYLPTRKQRNAATDATNLLQHIMIPQLQIDPVTQAVKTIANEEVSIFIDFMPATKEDLAGMNTQDVKRIDVYDFPKDVRFKNKPHVVNFVMQKYEIGGYTKLSTNNHLMSGKDYQASGSVYSKLAFKKWTLDANLSDTYSSYQHIGSEMEETFRLPAQTIVRTEIEKEGKFRTHRPSASLRATFNTEKVQLANRLEVLCNNTPTNETSGTVAYQPSIFSESGSLSRHETRNITPTYIGDWNFMFPKQWNLLVSSTLQYIKNDVNRFYREGNLQPIENDIKERASFANWHLGLSKTFGEKHTFSFSNFGQNYHCALDYSGSTTSDSKMNQFSIGQGVSYSFSGPKLQLSSSLVYGFTQNKMEDKTQTRWFPVININATYSPSSKHSLSLNLGRNLQGADLAERNPNVVRQNELLYYCGTPMLKEYNMDFVSLNHTWMPSNIVTVSSFAQYYNDRNYFANIYEPYLDGTAVLRRLDNVGDVITTSVGTSITLRLMEGNLQINASPRFNFYNITGRYDNSRSTFLCVSSATYYIKQFHIQAYAMSPQKYFSRLKNAWHTDRPYFQISAGWGNARWKAQLGICNPFRTDWRDTESTVNTSVYSFTKTEVNASSHQRLNLTVSYTFNYGKKVKQGNELKEASSGQSSIL